MASQSVLQKIYVLHSRAYRDTSLLLDCLTEEEGLISLVAKGAKRPKSPFRNKLMPFVPLLADWFGRGDLKTLKTAELVATAEYRVGEELFKGFYLNELLMKVLHKHDPCVEVFRLYQQVLMTRFTEVDLRRFEVALLKALGYELQLEHDVHFQQPIQADCNYYYEAEVGFSRADQGRINNSSATRYLFRGSDLIAINNDDYQAKEVLQAAKRLLRLAFTPLLGGRPLKSRELFFHEF